MLCQEGHLNIAEFLIKQSTEFEIDLNVRDKNGLTAFHIACLNGHSKLIEMILKKSIEFKIHLNLKSYNFGMTAFHWVSLDGKAKEVEIMIDNSKTFGLDLTLKNNDGKTAFQLAQQYQQTDIINLIKRKMPSIAVNK